MTATLYGIRACDTMKKARSWLEEKGVAFTFHDYKTAGVDRQALEAPDADRTGQKDERHDDPPEADRQRDDAFKHVGASP